MNDPITGRTQSFYIPFHQVTMTSNLTPLFTMSTNRTDEEVAIDGLHGFLKEYRDDLREIKTMLRNRK